jgi:hypothetical protein
MSKSRLRPSKSRSGSESGQGIVEYILILGFALATSVVMARFMSGGMDRGILLFGGALEKDLKTGRTPVASGWKN